MKMTKEDNVKVGTIEADDIQKIWTQAAMKLGLRTGVYAGVYVIGEEGYLSRIYFKLGEHEFDSLSDLRKAINNKAFL